MSNTTSNSVPRVMPVAFSVIPLLGGHRTYSLANGRGERVALASVLQCGLGSPRTAAARMAYAPEMAGALRAASMDYERTGAVSPEVISLMRRLLDEIGAA